LRREIKTRLIRHVTFLEAELDDFPGFNSLSWEEYNKHRDKRRNVERWIENIVNSSIDISKIILSSESTAIPDTYRGIVTSLSLVSGFDKENVQRIAEWVRLRNIISHEYLDIRWGSINRFIQEAEAVYRDFLESARIYISKNL
jgi:uncharacterized protein YutE (UPF0331/DUF86 family)